MDGYITIYTIALKYATYLILLRKIKLTVVCFNVINSITIIANVLEFLKLSTKNLLINLKRILIMASVMLAGINKPISFFSV